MKMRFDVARGFDLLLRICGAVSGLILITIMLMVCIKVFLRYVVGYGWIGVDQLSGTLLLYMTFLGAAWVLSREQHVTIDFLVTRLTPRTRRAVLVIGSIVSALVCLLVFVYGTLEVIESLKRNILVAAELEIPRAINIAVIPFGCLLLWIQFARRAWRALRADPDTVDSG